MRPRHARKRGRPGRRWAIDARSRRLPSPLWALAKMKCAASPGGTFSLTFYFWALRCQLTTDDSTPPQSWFEMDIAGDNGRRIPATLARESPDVVVYDIESTTSRAADCFLSFHCRGVGVWTCPTAVRAAGK